MLQRCFDQDAHKPGYRATGDDKKLEIFYLESKEIALFIRQKQKCAETTQLTPMILFSKMHSEISLMTELTLYSSYGLITLRQ